VEFRLDTVERLFRDVVLRDVALMFKQVHRDIRYLLGERRDAFVCLIGGLLGIAEMLAHEIANPDQQDADQRRNDQCPSVIECHVIPRWRFYLCILEHEHRALCAVKARRSGNTAQCDPRAARSSTTVVLARRAVSSGSARTASAPEAVTASPAVWVQQCEPWLTRFAALDENDVTGPGRIAGTRGDCSANIRRCRAADARRADESAIPARTNAKSTEGCPGAIAAVSARDAHATRADGYSGARESRQTDNGERAARAAAARHHIIGAHACRRAPASASVALHPCEAIGRARRRRVGAGCRDELDIDQRAVAANSTAELKIRAVVDDFEYLTRAEIANSQRARSVLYDRNRAEPVD